MNAPAPDVGDVLIAASSFGYPAVDLAGVAIAGGQRAWEAAITALSPEKRLEFWIAFGQLEPLGTRAAPSDNYAPVVSPNVEDTDVLTEFGHILRQR